MNVASSLMGNKYAGGWQIADSGDVRYPLLMRTWNVPVIVLADIENVKRE
jgi:hypothetical protein